jgi:hypothetical protein
VSRNVPNSAFTTSIPEPMRELEIWVHQFAAQKEQEFQRLDKVLEIEKQKLKIHKPKKEKK